MNKNLVVPRMHEQTNSPSQETKSTSAIVNEIEKKTSMDIKPKKKRSIFSDPHPTAHG